MTYSLPFTVSEAAIIKIAKIPALIERYIIRMKQECGLWLRKANRIKMIKAALTITRFAGATYYSHGEGYFEEGCVKKLKIGDDYVSAAVHGFTSTRRNMTSRKSPPVQAFFTIAL